MRKKFLKGKMITLALIASMLTCSSSTYADATTETFSEEAVIYYADSEDASYAWGLTKDDNGKDAWVKVLISELPEGANVEYDHNYVWAEGIRYEKDTVSDDSINQTEDLSEVVETPETPTEDETSNNSENEDVLYPTEQSECSEVVDIELPTDGILGYDLPEAEDGDSDFLLEPEFFTKNRNCPGSDWENFHVHQDGSVYEEYNFYFMQSLAREQIFPAVNKYRREHGVQELIYVCGDAGENYSMYRACEASIYLGHFALGSNGLLFPEITTYCSIYEDGTVADVAIRSFDESPSHKAVLLNSYYKYCSIGVVRVGPVHTIVINFDHE